MWFSTQSKQQPGLRWGGSVYTSKQDFDVYLKSRGLSYKTWVARNPGAAPWEPTAVRVATKAPETPEGAEARESWIGRPLLAAMGLMLVGGCSLLLIRRRRSVTLRLQRGTTDFYDPVAVRLPRGSAAVPMAASATIRRVGLATSGATGRLRVWLPIFAARLVASARTDARWLADRMGERGISGGDVAYSMLALGAAVVFALVIVLVLSP
jgi:hypothetical protein